MADRNGAATTTQASAQPDPQLNVHDIQGRLTELTDLHAAVTSRCVGMRGQMAMKDQEIARLTQANEKLSAELASLLAAAEAAKEPPGISRVKGPAGRA